MYANLNKPEMIIEGRQKFTVTMHNHASIIATAAIVHKMLCIHGSCKLSYICIIMHSHYHTYKYTKI